MFIISPFKCDLSLSKLVHFNEICIVVTDVVMAFCLFVLFV